MKFAAHVILTMTIKALRGDEVLVALFTLLQVVTITGTWKSRSNSATVETFRFARHSVICVSFVGRLARYAVVVLCEEGAYASDAVEMTHSGHILVKEKDVHASVGHFSTPPRFVLSERVEDQNLILVWVENLIALLNKGQMIFNGIGRKIRRNTNRCQQWQDILMTHAFWIP